MNDNRDEFTKDLKRILQERVGNRCSNPGCRKLTSGPNFNSQKATRIGVAAHITAASPGGPRFDPQLSIEERKSITNAIWLCQNCGTLVDRDEKTYPVKLLEQWKISAEDSARKELEGNLPNNQPLVPEDNSNSLKCPFCGSTVKSGLLVCTGCHAEIIRGATRDERRRAKTFGRFFGGFFSFFTGVYIIMALMTSAADFSAQLEVENHAFIIMLINTLVTIFLFGILFPLLANWLYKKKGYRFFRSSSFR